MNLACVMGSLWHKYVPVRTLLTEVYGVNANNSPVLQLVIIPGNPGSAAFYTHFMQCLHKTFKGAVDVLCISHLGHDTGANNSDQVCTHTSIHTGFTASQRIPLA